MEGHRQDAFTYMRIKSNENIKIFSLLITAKQILTAHEKNYPNKLFAYNLYKCYLMRPDTNDNMVNMNSELKHVRGSTDTG